MLHFGGFLLLFSMLKPNDNSNAYSGKKEDFPRESTGYKDGGRAVRSADDSNTHGFFHSVSSARVGSQLTMISRSFRESTLGMALP